MRRGAWPTYTVGYGSGFADDELADAHKTARAFSSRHVSVELTTEMFERYLPAVVSSLEEPVAAALDRADVRGVSTSETGRQVASWARAGRTLRGYTRHLGVHYGPLWRKSPAFLRRAVAPMLAAIPRHASIQRGLYALDVEDQFQRFRNVFLDSAGDEVDSLFRDGLIEPGCGDAISRLLVRPEVQASGTPTSLVRSNTWRFDRRSRTNCSSTPTSCSMAHGLEVRVSLSRRQVVEYAQRLATGLKISLGRRSAFIAQCAPSFCPRGASAQEEGVRRQRCRRVVQPIPQS